MLVKLNWFDYFESKHEYAANGIVAFKSKKLSKMLKSLPIDLEELDITISDASYSVVDVCGALSRFTKLITLRLTNFFIAKDALNCPGLEIITLVNCSVHTSALQKLPELWKMVIVKIEIVGGSNLKAVNSDCLIRTNEDYEEYDDFIECWGLLVDELNLNQAGYDEKITELEELKARLRELEAE
jgi:hypothetical protein